MTEGPLVPDEVTPWEERGAPEPEGSSWAREAVLALPNLLKLIGRLMRDPRVPLRTRAFALAILAYLVSPIDLIPDALPVLGQADDLFLAAMALQHLLNGVGEEVVREHWDGSGDVLDLIRGVLDWGAD
ncbi:MAG: YkvA family protein, partial [Actinomycetota bacterium]|nr:YkvA family protein [Actinomycetota bacterium]